MSIDEVMAAGSLERMAGNLRSIRRELHRHPEVGLDLPQTQRIVIEELEKCGVELRTGRALSSVVATIRGARPGPTVLIRTDMDALPIAEESAEPFASANPNAMHSCGHDLHMAAAIGAVRILSQLREEMRGDVVIMFQPGEENDAGASLMLDEGVLTRTRSPIEAAYAVHVGTHFAPAGSFALKPGVVMASSDAIDITLTGSGGHAGFPRECADPVSALASILLSLQVMIARSTSGGDSSILSVGRVEAGTVRNAIPAVAIAQGTLRCFSETARNEATHAVARIVRETASAYGLESSCRIERGYPVLMNDQGAVERAVEVITGLYGPAAVVEQPAALGGSEDFAYVLDEVPGCMMLFGAAHPDEEDPPSNHAPTVRFDDSRLPQLAAAMAAIALSHVSAMSWAGGAPATPVLATRNDNGGVMPV